MYLRSVSTSTASRHLFSTLGIDGVLQRMMEDLKKQAPEDIALATLTLAWLTFPTRPITMEEIGQILESHAHMVNPHGPTSIPTCQLLYNASIVCGGLMDVDFKNDIVRLANDTTQQFLKREQHQ